MVQSKRKMKKNTKIQELINKTNVIKHKKKKYDDKKKKARSHIVQDFSYSSKRRSPNMSGLKRKALHPNESKNIKRKKISSTGKNKNKKTTKRLLQSIGRGDLHDKDLIVYSSRKHDESYVLKNALGDN